jgi:thymidylate synthase ThyX
MTIKVWHEGNSDVARGKLFSKIESGIKEMLSSGLKESLPTQGVKDIARTLMSKKVGKNLYVSPNGRIYRRVLLNGQKASKGKPRH